MIQQNPTVRRRIPILDLFSSVRFGIALLTLILIYASIVSAVMPVRAWLEVTEMEAFQHWIFGTLIVLFCITLTTTTLRRIRFNVTNLGVLTVHSGLLLLAGGSLLYFGRKVEGDVVLHAPRVEVVSLTGSRERLPMLLAETGRTWEGEDRRFAARGKTRITVLETKGSGLDLVEEATVRIELPNQPPREVTLSAKHSEPVVIKQDRYAVRLVTFAPEATFFDKDAAALYIHPAGTAVERMVPRALPGLPLHTKRYLPDEEGVLSDRFGRPVESNRTTPAIDLGLALLPTGWIANWRLPISPQADFRALTVRAKDPAALEATLRDSSKLPFDVRVTGYLPYVADMRPSAFPGGDQPNPAVRLRLKTSAGPFESSLFANEPQHSLLSAGEQIEFRWAGSAEEREAELAPLVGPHELYIELKDPPIRQTVSATVGAPIRIPDTAYELTVLQFVESWPLVSPGYEGVESPVALVAVSNGTTQFTRAVVQRFAREAPSLTQDIDDQGNRQRTPIDANLVLRYRSSQAGQLRKLVAGPTAADVVELGVFDRWGQVQRLILPHLASGASTDARLAVLGVFERSRMRMIPIVEVPEMMRPNLGRQPSAIRVQLTGQGEFAGWSAARWLMFSRYPEEAAAAALEPPLRTPDGRTWELIYSRLKHDLGGELVLRRLRTEYFPGQMQADSWFSYVLGRRFGGDTVVEGQVSTNRTWTFGEWSLFQSGAPDDENDWAWTGLGVGNREGIWPMLIGCVLIPLGCLYAFYVKPVLRRRAAERAVAAARERNSAQPATDAAAPELIEV